MGCSTSSRVSGPPSMFTLDTVPLRSGESSVLYRGVEKNTNTVVAVKAISKSHSERFKVEGEIDMLRRFSNHPNIVDFVCSYETPSEIHVVVEYMQGGGLFNVIPRHGLESELDAAEYVKDITAALCYLHRNCVAHRNLKPENLMISHALGGDLKVCDFGCAKSLPTEDAPMWDVCGTWAYAAPEVLWLQRTSEGSYTLKCDLFAVGVILFYLLVGHHPFDPFGQDTREEVCDNICQGVWGFDQNSWYGVSPEAKNVVTALLEVDPRKRFKAKQLACHPWLRQSVSFGPAAGVRGCLQQSHQPALWSNDTKIIGTASPGEVMNTAEQPRQQSHPSSNQARSSPSKSGRDNQPGTATFPVNLPLKSHSASTSPKRNITVAGVRSKSYVASRRTNKSVAEIGPMTNQFGLTIGRPTKITPS